MRDLVDFYTDTEVSPVGVWTNVPREGGVDVARGPRGLREVTGGDVIPRREGGGGASEKKRHFSLGSGGLSRGPYVVLGRSRTLTKKRHGGTHTTEVVLGNTPHGSFPQNRQPWS